MALPDLKYQSDLLDGEKEFFAAFLSYGVTGWLSASLDHSAPLMAQSTVTQSANVTRKVRGSHDFFLDTVQYQTEALDPAKFKPIEEEIAGRAS